MIGQRLVIDPVECECTDCILGDSVPADRLTERRKDRVAQDDPGVIDRTGYSERDWDQILLTSM